jgi:hypothetical protein
MDRRFWPATERVAHISLRGQVAGVSFVEGDALQIGAALADLLRAPDGPRERQLLRGDGFTVIEDVGGWAFGFATRDGYCGWVRRGALIAPLAISHWVASCGTHLHDQPRVQASSEALPMRAGVQVTGMAGAFAEVVGGYVPATHLREIGDWLADPVAVAEMFLGTPYLWGGNSRAGIDCSGLVQGAFLACGLACPGDSDLQAAMGAEVPEGAALRRGDLVFWKGHVAMMVDDARIIHANGHSMDLRIEGLEAAAARIAARGGGPVTGRRRV